MSRSYRMRPRPRPRLAPFLLAIVVSLALVLSAPFVGYVRSWIRTRFPGQFVRIIATAIGILGAAAVTTALARIRTHRALRYAALMMSIVCAVAYSVWQATGVPEVDVVQRFHFIEYGIIAFLFYRAWRPLDDPAIIVLPFLAALMVGTVDEWLQWFIPNRVGEMADIFLNGIAIGCGLVFSVGALPPAAFSWRWHPGSLRRIGAMAAAFVLLFGVFFHVVHLGYDVVDDEIGRFKSRYTSDTLRKLVDAKAEQWRVHPFPLVLQRVSREDQYMTEGVTHVQKRNELLAAGDVGGAWRENRILEKYYTPVLDTPSYISRTGHRWSAEQRGDVQSRTPAVSRDYVSAANPSPIYAWPRAPFWIAVIAIAAVIWLTCARLDRPLPGTQ
jgi:VanZ like family